MSGRQKTLNLKQVAHILGVSTATVSNAFNRPDQLSQKLREKILKETAELGYFGPNLAARSLRKGQSDVIAVILADTLSYSFSDPVASQFLRGVSDILVDHKKQLLMLSSKLTSTEQSSAESLPDGFIFYGAPQGDCFERIARTGKPVIAVDFETESVPSINIDNLSAAKNAASHAIRNNNSQVAVLGLRMIESERVCRLTEQDINAESKDIAHRRLQGYLEAVSDRGCSMEANMVWHTPINTGEMAEIAAREALTTTPRPNVLLCMSDVIALAALRVAKTLNISVPDELNVVGFDDIPEAARTQPALTTVCQQSIEKGRLAASMLLEEEPITDKEMSTKLVVRESTTNY